VADPDEAAGVRIVKKALLAPLSWIAANAGDNGDVVVAKVSELPDGQGYNAATGVYGDLVADGVIDPVKVTRSAVQHAGSIAAMLLTTEALVVDKPEDEDLDRGDRFAVGREHLDAVVADAVVLPAILAHRDPVPAQRQIEQVALLAHLGIERGLLAGGEVAYVHVARVAVGGVGVDQPSLREGERTDPHVFVAYVRRIGQRHRPQGRILAGRVDLEAARLPARGRLELLGCRA
jgi:hypothetical protein